jgi:hypothetical protein
MTVHFDVTRDDVNLILARLTDHYRTAWFQPVLDVLIAATLQFHDDPAPTARLELANEPGEAFGEWLALAALAARNDPAAAKALVRVHESKR